MHGSHRPDQNALLQLARRIAQARTTRGRYFRKELFAEPAWDMLLDLFIAHLESRPVYVSSLCIAANVPQTTALRYIQDLERNGEIVSHVDSADGRRRWLQLTEDSVAAMSAMLAARLGLGDPDERMVN
jgi:DNA-binding MarR family transcriptional regulator